MKRQSMAFLGVALCILALAACASKPATLPGGTVEQNAVMQTATVEKIDMAKRLVTLRGSNGDSVTFKADERVKNLPQVKVGDLVTVSYYESLAYQVRKPGDAVPGMVESGGLVTAKPGEKPGMDDERVVTLTTKILAIDKKAPSVTLEGADGSPVTVVVKDPKNLDTVKVGDLVEITYTRALAISVDPAPGK